ncbi:MAG: CDP-alcohol phosphatidyltransferase family protein [Gemmatimonadaceae bacterium]
MNLPNSLTVGRIIAAPVVALLPLMLSWQLRLLGFVLFIAVAITDYYDGKLARSRNLVTNLGKLLDPLADKLLLLATFVPMYILQRRIAGTDPRWVDAMRESGDAGITARAEPFPFLLPGWGTVFLPAAVIAVVLGRELFMTVFRQAAARRGVIIAAIGPAKWKTGFQWTWVGSAYFWFAALTAAIHFQWLRHDAWHAFAYFNGVVGTVTMIAAVVLTLYSLWLYLRRYGTIFRAGRS